MSFGYTAVDVFGRFLPRRCAKDEAPTGSSVVFGWEVRAL